MDGLAFRTEPAPEMKHLRDADTRLRLALQSAQIGVWEFDTATGELVWDARVREVVEADPEAAPTWDGDFLPALHVDDVARVQAVFGQSMSQPDGATFSVEFRVVGRRSGTVTWASLTGQVEDTPHGRRILGTARDITAEREGAELIRAKSQALEERIEEALAERRIWADIVEASADPIVAVDRDLNFIALNKAYVDACQRLFGVRFRIGDNLSAALSHMPQVRDAALSLWSRALEGKSFELRTGEADPGGRFYDNRFGALRDQTGAVVGAYQASRDVTARVKAEAALKETAEALQRAQKMEAIGNLTGGIAHDFNNLLMVVSGNLQLLGRDIAGNERAERRVSNALHGVSRGAKLAGQLLAFGRRQALEPRVTNVGRLVVGMDDLLRRTLGEEIEIETSASGGLWNTMVDPAQVENALLNLAINARDAMGGQGRLTIEVSNATLDDAYARLNSEVAAGQYVLIAVSDTGSGMPAEVMERVFEPFFSTKPEGHGTGLGLSMVHGFVKQSEGHIKIYSEVGHGTTVKLYLPRSLGDEDVRNEPPPARAIEGDATILVVEDDEQVRDTAVSLLQDLGYRVLKAADAASALAIVESGVAIDLIFTDVVMPGPMRSVELAQRARDRLPGVAILFTSGYTRNAVVHGGRLDAGVELLAKPYSRDDLGLKVARVLASKADRGAPGDDRLHATGQPRGRPPQPD